MSAGKRRIAVLGGGMGSLSAVFWLTSRPDWKERYEITVHQLGWRLGGKVASGRRRDFHDRSEEHGYHVLLGFYECAFRTMRACYEELGRDAGAPLSRFVAPTLEEEQAAPWRYAVARNSRLSLLQPFGGGYQRIPLDLPLDDRLPGDGDPPDAWTLLEGAWRLFWNFATHPDHACHPIARDEHPVSDDGGVWSALRSRVSKVIGEVEHEVSALGHLRIAGRLVDAAVTRRLAGALLGEVARLVADLVKVFVRLVWAWVKDRIDDDWDSYRSWILLDFAASNLCGLLTDDVLIRGFDHLNDTNYLDWWMSHGAVPEGSLVTARSSFGQFPFDLVFGYRHGDSTSEPPPDRPVRGQPDMEAGTMLRGMLRFLLAYKGAPEWMFQAGCGEALVAPMYQVLARRGVRIEFFRRVRRLRLDDSRRFVEAIEMEQQATPIGTYEPLFDVKGIPCWPREPFYEQLVEGEALKRGRVDLESSWTDWRGRDLVLRRGEDFDDVLLGISLGALPEIAAELIEASPAWREMVRRVETNRTMVFQAWFGRELDALGWRLPTLNADSGTQPFNLATSMDPIIERESWPADARPACLIYFSGVAPDDPAQPAPPDPAYPIEQHRRLRATIVEALETGTKGFLPDASDPKGFDWSVLWCPRHPEARGEARLDEQYWRVNIDGSERYVLSVTGSSAWRLAAGASGFENLYLAGDWLRTGLDCGSVEAAFMSGMQASRAIAGYPREVPGERDGTT